MSKHTVGVDLDGVVTTFYHDWRSLYLRDFGRMPKETSSWGAFFRDTHFKDDKEYWHWLSGTDCWENPGVYDDSLDALHELCTQYDVHIITSKPAWAVARTSKWLADLDMPFKCLHIGEFQKSWVQCDAYVDDGPHNLLDFIKNRPEAITVRLKRIWNEEFDGDDRMLHIESLKELPPLLDEKLNKKGALSGQEA